MRSFGLVVCIWMAWLFIIRMFVARLDNMLVIVLAVLAVTTVATVLTGNVVAGLKSRD